MLIENIEIEEVEPDYDLIEKAIHVVSDASDLSDKGNWQRWCSIQFHCGTETGMSLAKPLYGACSKALQKEAPEFTEAQRAYVLIPTITFCLCDSCPRNPYVGLAEHFNIPECGYGMLPELNAEWKRTSEGEMDRGLLRKEFYHEFWGLNKILVQNM